MASIRKFVAWKVVALFGDGTAIPAGTKRRQSLPEADTLRYPTTFWTLEQ